MRLQSIIKDIIVESDKRNSIKSVLGFSDEWANEFHSLDEKLSIWIAGTFLKEMSREYPVTNIEKTPTIERINSSGVRMSLWQSDYRQKYRYILDWIRSPRRTEQIKLKELSFKAALEKSKEWHDSLEDNVFLNYEEKNEIVIDYRNEKGVGFYWVNLNTDFSKEESERMGHCGRDGGCVLFSLRSLNEFGESKSHITISYSKQDKKIHQIKGRKNSKPKEVYYKYIIDFLINEKYPVSELSKSSGFGGNDFTLNDLSEDVLNGIFEKNKDLKFYYLYGDKKIVMKNGDNENIVLFKEESKSGYYGIMNTETDEVIKSYQYVIDDNSMYSEFMHFPKENKVITLKHFVVAPTKRFKDDFIIKVMNQKFYIIDKKEADEILSSSEKESFDDWSKTKIKGD